MDDFKKIKISGWTWSVRKPEILKRWFPGFKDLLEKNSIKRNSNRSVFTVDADGERYFVKFNSSYESLSKIISYLHPKSRTELDGTEILRSANIRTLEIEGWGFCNSQSMLVTNELKGAINSKNFWFDTVSVDEKKKKLFLVKLAMLVSSLIRNGIFHPDFHLGNLLVLPGTMDFAVIDPYGVKKKRKLGESQVVGMLAIFGSLRGEISEGAAVEILDDVIDRAGIAKFADTKKLWKKIVKTEDLEMEKSWTKRKKHILGESSKYVLRCGEWLIRKSISGMPLASEDEISPPGIDGNFEVLRLIPEKALEIWLDSFIHDFLRKKSRTPVAMNTSGREYVLLYRRRMRS